MREKMKQQEEMEEVKQAPSKAETLQTEPVRKMKLPIFIADAFTTTAFHGNPAAVCLLENTLDEDSHQHIAREMNLSETAFIRKLQPTANFTQKNTNSTLTFATMSGELKARRAEDGIVLDFPLYPAFPQDFHEVEDLIKAAIGDTLVQDIRYSPDTKNLMVRLSDSYNRSFLETLKVNTEPLPGIEKTGKVKGLILTLRGEPGGQTPQYDFYSRYFAPWVGVAEDPVTGSAHTILGPYWSEELGKKEMRAFQCSRRGGELDISLRPDGRVDMKGGAAIVLEGTLTEVKQAPSKAETLQTEPVRKMKLPIFIADAFTTTAFRGNPAAVCLLENDFHEVEGLIKAAIGDTLVQDIQYSPDTRKLLVRLSDSYSRSFLETLKVNTKPLPGIEKTGKVKGLILTLRGQPEGQTPQYDFYSRYFAPWVGLPEDPVTGSAHTVLSSYWSQQLGKKEMRDKPKQQATSAETNKLRRFL
ncbi:phenazine biosynthesis-like domain-containing protein 2 [Cricetulus griseus]|uniref:Phenazine biosynthesis-like domain-containing protein 2 n=1 Tax=Cricetulus griseus TaxID=10029 RepID=A0A061IN13_CRIGR|nr:phenazine biosynthesis-like domain-containing protein 2 [Cricetulus griseus]